MAVDLPNVLTGETAGSAHQQQQHLIQASLTSGIQHVAIDNTVRLPVLPSWDLHDRTADVFRHRA